MSVRAAGRLHLTQMDVKDNLLILNLKKEVKWEKLSEQSEGVSYLHYNPACVDAIDSHVKENSRVCHVYKREM